MSDIVIAEAKRTAIGSFLGQFTGVPTPTLGAAAIAAVAGIGVAGRHVAIQLAPADQLGFCGGMGLDYMLEAGFGRIVNISSINGQKGQFGQANYSAAKAGLIGATRALARELGRRNVLVNAVAPGFISTEMTAGLPVDEYMKSVPLGRPGLPEEVAGCVRFLCSNLSSYVTGQVLSVNGGLYM